MKVMSILLLAAAFAAVGLTYAAGEKRASAQPAAQKLEAEKPASAATAARARFDKATADAKEAYRKAVIAADEAYINELRMALAAANSAKSEDLPALDAALHEAQDRLQQDRSAAPAPAVDRARQAAARANLASLSTALAMFEIDNGRMPTTAEGLDALVHQPPDAPSWHGPYVKTIPLDPWGRPYVYRCPGTRHETSYDLLSPGPDGKEAGGDDVERAD